MREGPELNSSERFEILHRLVMARRVERNFINVEWKFIARGKDSSMGSFKDHLENSANYELSKKQFILLKNLGAGWNWQYLGWENMAYTEIILSIFFDEEGLIHDLLFPFNSYTAKFPGNQECFPARQNALIWKK